MQSLKGYLTRFLRFLRGEGVTTDWGQFKRFITILGLATLLGALLTPLAIVFTQPHAHGGGTVLLGAPTLKRPTPTHTTIPTPIATNTPVSRPGVPVKGLTDNPAYQWWEWPNHPQPDSWWGDAQNAQSLGAQISLMQELGVQLFRVELPWPFVAPTMPGGSAYDSTLAQNPDWGGYQWSRFDLIVQLTTQAGIQLVPQVVYSPDWASGVAATTNGGPDDPPQSAQYFGDFMTAAVTRYKGQIHYWEMWNEPDAPHTWSGTPQQYVDLVLQPGYQAVKQVDPTAKVIFGGLAGAKMQAYYTAGAGPYFDIGNVHAYYQASSADSTAFSLVRGTMNQNGDQQKPVWMTEFGWATRQASSSCADISQPGDDGEAAQAQLISDLYKSTGLQALFFYQLHDTAVYASGDACAKAVYWGLVTHDLSRRKAGFDAYKNAPGGLLPALTTLSALDGSPTSRRMNSALGAPTVPGSPVGTWWPQARSADFNRRILGAPQRHLNHQTSLLGEGLAEAAASKGCL